MILCSFLAWMGWFSSSEHLLYPTTLFSCAPSDYIVPCGIISLKMLQNGKKMLNYDEVHQSQKFKKVKNQ